jgi:hypothetical protein
VFRCGGDLPVTAGRWGGWGWFRFRRRPPPGGKYRNACAASSVSGCPARSGEPGRCGHRAGSAAPGFGPPDGTIAGAWVRPAMGSAQPVAGALISRFLRRPGLLWKREAECHVGIRLRGAEASFSFWGPNCRVPMECRLAAAVPRRERPEFGGAFRDVQTPKGAGGCEGGMGPLTGQGPGL